MGAFYDSPKITLLADLILFFRVVIGGFFVGGWKEGLIALQLYTRGVW